MFRFKILTKDKRSKARLGILKTPHGIIHTPNLAIVATKGSIRGLSFEQARKFGAEIFMVNTFHFFRQERYKIVQKFGGLHKFLNINYPLMTDSGGFQIFSLGFGMEHKVGKVADIFPEEKQINADRAVEQSTLSDPKPNFVLVRSYTQTKNGQNRKGNKSEQSMLSPKKSVNNKNLVKVYDDGVEFIDPYNGQKLFLSPEISIKVQKILGADIIFAFDECTSPLSTYEYTKKALKRTHQWAIKCLDEFSTTKKQVLFGIVQGGEYEDLRKESAKFVNSLPFFGFGIGGSLGKSKKDIIKVLNWTLPYLYENKPRHLLGIGEIDDIFNAIEQGIDLFDCVIPTRWARHGTGFSFQGRINLKSSKYLTDRKPIDLKCQCQICQKYPRSYICHLLREKEIYGIMLLTEHNVFWILNLFKQIRKSIKENNFKKFKNLIINKWY
ncbi:MAG: tRNA-guanine(34) transglycosylase [Candidatus Parcubacteria bacterium]|nr:MAG: tRNA-guanine(34) transglycosylase [Candidatus Parcubacteria bacterium]